MGLLEDVEYGVVRARKLVIASAPGRAATGLVQPAAPLVRIVGPIVAQRTTDGDTDMVTVPGGMTVTAVKHQVIVASAAATQAIDIGDAADPNGWIAAVDGKGTAGTIVSNTGAYGTAALIAAEYGKLYAVDTVLTATTDVTTPGGAVGSHRVIVEGYFI